MFEVFADMQQGHYVRSTSQTNVKARAAKHAVNHLDPNLLSRGKTCLADHLMCQCDSDVSFVANTVSTSWF